jgi:plastocyanin
MKRLLLATAAVVVLGLALGSCGEDDPELVEGVREPVDALDNSFAPEELTVRAGTEVVFANKGRNEHNVIPSDDGGEDFTIDVDELPPGGPPVARRFTEPGTYDYFCSIHGTATTGMIGSITVEG